MENLRNKTMYELMQNIDDILSYLYLHNKNYTKEQYFKIINLIDITTELKERL